MGKIRFLLLIAGVFTLAAASSSAGSSKKVDPKTAEENLRKAQAAAAPADSALGWLARAAWVGVVSRGTSEWQAADRLLSSASQAAGDLKTGADRLVDLAERKSERAAIEKETRSFLDKVKLVRLGQQAEELDRLGRLVRNLPVGLVSEQVDEKFKVSRDLLVKDPKEAESRFKAYLAAMKTNADFLTTNERALERTATNARAAAQVVRRLQTGVEKAIPFGGPHSRALTELYVDLDKLAKGYAGLAADCGAKAKQARHAAEVERRRHDNLRAVIRTAFGFEG